MGHIGCSNRKSAPSQRDGGQEECAIQCSILQVCATNPWSNQYHTAIAVSIPRARGHKGAQGLQVVLCQAASLCQAEDINALVPLPAYECSFFSTEATLNIESDHLEGTEQVQLCHCVVETAGQAPEVL